MFPRLLVICALACAGCDLFGPSESATLRLTVTGSTNRDGFNALDSYQGLGGLHVTLTGAVERTFTAADFLTEPYDFQADPFPVPDHGVVFAEALILTANGVAVARVSGAWTLEPGTNWRLGFHRRQERDPPTDDLSAGCGLGFGAGSCRGAFYSNKIWTCPAFTDSWFLWLMVGDFVSSLPSPTRERGSERPVRSEQTGEARRASAASALQVRFRPHG
ncbi:MAG: hypothetical protein OXE73_06995 [Gammaproteobacteria bacterium]|nr:hypothetical protein [Gammaproteobacteria bacterium]